jgi:signal transduction histidine kinase
MSPCEPAQQEVVRPSATMPPVERCDFTKGLIDGMRCGVLAIDADGRLAWINEQALRILDLQDSATVGSPVGEALPDHPSLARALTSSFEMAVLPNRAEMSLDGSDRRIGFTLSLVRDELQRAVGAAIFFKDLTPIEHAEEQERLKDRLAALGKMAASMAHEIRNPLASIEVNCKLLERRLDEDSTCRELLDKIVAEVKRLDGSIDSCLRYVRPVTLSPAPADLGPLLQEAVAVAGERRGKPGVTVETRVADDIPPFLMDRSVLRQAFINLVLNALEAVGDRGRVLVEAWTTAAPGAASVPYQQAEGSTDPWSEADGYAVVRVSDSGPGIDPDDLDRIFQPFFTTKQQGSGVGLAVVKKIVASHRGMIDVTSAPGEGAEIVIRLPMAGRLTKDRAL